MQKRRKIAVVTTSRADYGHLYWPLREMETHPEIDLQLIAMGAHLSPEFGDTVTEIERDGFSVARRVECLLSSDSDVGMAKTIGVAALGLADVLGEMRPDLLLLIADRYELMAPASVALALRIPIAHIEGGDISEGAVDEAVRHALTKISHLHFTPTEKAERRVLAMGEERWRVLRTGAPSLDHLRRRKLWEREALSRELDLDLARPTAVVAYHPVTLHAADTLLEADALFESLSSLPLQIAFCFPNADAGSRSLIRRAEAFCREKAQARLFVNLNHLKYWSLLRHSAIMLGNSSSGIMETPSLELPTVNIGIRQQGRERARNIVDAPADPAAIARAVETASSPAFRAALAGMTNPYGDGRASERILRRILEAPLGEKLLMKRTVFPGID